MVEILIGSEAVAAGTLTRHALQRWYHPVYPGVHMPKRSAPTVRDLTVAAWMWSRRRGVIAGVAASALHCAQWIDERTPIEMLGTCTRPPQGIVVRNESYAADEVTRVAGIPVTTVARTAFDLGRYLGRDAAIARLDALMYATRFCPDEVLGLADRHFGARGVRRLRAALPLVDGGAASPRETSLRLLFVDAGLPAPSTQIPVVEDHGRLVRMLDMGWEEYLVAAEYDGDQHRTNRWQYVRDLRAIPRVEAQGWIVIRVIKEDRADEVVDRARRALVSRGWKP